MADLYNRKPILGVRLVEDGETMHNGAPVFGVYEVDSSVSFDDSQYVLGVDVLDTDETMNNMQPVRGVVLIEDGRRMYNNRRVVPAFAVGGSFSQDIIITVGKEPGSDTFGYADGSFSAAFGSISGVPVEGHPIIMAVSLISAGYVTFQIFIQGDVVDLLDGKTVWVDGVPYTSANPGNGWAYLEPVDMTSWQTLEFPALLEEGSQHKIEIKENPWTPAVLFENGEPGAWYDPSGLSTVFQDAAGTTPAVPGSPVGLVLDARKEMGPEMVPNPNFSNNAAGWSTNSWTLNDGSASITSGATGAYLASPFGTSSAEMANKWWVVEFDIGSISAGAVGAVGAGSGVSIDGTHRQIVYSPTNSRLRTYGITTATITRVSWKELHSIPLSQPTTAARPILARMPLTGRRNLLTASETETQNALGTSAADGVVTVGNGDIPIKEFTPTGGTGTAGPGKDYPNAVGVDVTLSVYVLPKGNRYIYFSSNSFGVQPNVGLKFRYDTQTQSMVSIYSNNDQAGSAKVQELGGGLFRCVISIRPNSAVSSKVFSVFCSNELSNAGGPTTSITFTDPPISPFSYGGWQAENRGDAALNPDPTPYQRVTNAYDVTEEGVPDTYSLVYDLADDALTTTIPQAVNGDILIAGTKGSIIEPVSYAAGSTFTIGPDTYTGGAAGVMSAVGPVVGLILIDRTLTQNERDNLLSYYSGRGAGSLLT